jgi:hypothetical protein
MASAWCEVGLDLRQRLGHHRSDEHSHQLSYNSIFNRTVRTVKPPAPGFTLIHGFTSNPGRAARFAPHSQSG